MDNNQNEKMTPEKQIEICNAINAAIAIGKIVTVDLPDIAHVTQIAGAFPNCDDILLVMHLHWDSRESVPILRLGNKHTIRAYFPATTEMDVIHNPNSTI